MTKTIEYLPWDSVFFERKIGKIYLDNDYEIRQIIEKSMEENYHLIYIFSNSEFDNFSGDKYLLKLVDKKMVYTKTITEIEPYYYRQNVSPEIVQEYTEQVISSDLERLAYLSGAYSRFRLDNGFSEGDFTRMYRTWLEKSISKDIADKIFIIKEHDKIEGFITLKCSIDNGTVGLLAVDECMQGKGYGRLLINRCLVDLWENSIFKVDVATQFNNKGACVFYSKCGFRVKSMVNIYHLWLPPPPMR